MADLATALAGMFGGGDMTIFQAVVDEVGSGVVTIHYNGGTFTDVPYMQAGFYPAAGPVIGDPCYVVARKGWGALVIGKPAPGPDRSPVSDGQTYTWTQSNQGTFNYTDVAGGAGSYTYTAVGANQLTYPDDGAGNPQVALWWYTPPVPSMPSTAALSTAAIYLGGSWTQRSDPAMDWAYLEVGLTSTNYNQPTAGLAKISGQSAIYRVPRTFDGWYTIPIGWASQLISGAAKGIYAVDTDEFGRNVTFTGSGQLRITTL